MAGKVYKNQDYLRIRVHVGETLSDATAIIKYKDPNSDTGDWAVTVENELEGIVYRDFTASNSLGVSGTWTFWSYVTFSDGRVAPGEPFTELIYDEGS